MREAIFKTFLGRPVSFCRWSSSVLYLGKLSFSQFRAPLSLLGNSGQPDSVWRLTDCLWNLCVKYSLSFPKTDFVGRLFVTVRRLIVAQKRKQRSAIKTTWEARLPLVWAQKLTKMHQTNLPNKSVIAGSIPVRLSHYNMRKRNE